MVTAFSCCRKRPSVRSLRRAHISSRLLSVAWVSSICGFREAGSLTFSIGKGVTMLPQDSPRTLQMRARRRHTGSPVVPTSQVASLFCVEINQLCRDLGQDSMSRGMFGSVQYRTSKDASLISRFPLPGADRNNNAAETALFRATLIIHRLLGHRGVAGETT